MLKGIGAEICPRNPPAAAQFRAGVIHSTKECPHAKPPYEGGCVVGLLAENGHRVLVGKTHLVGFYQSDSQEGRSGIPPYYGMPIAGRICRNKKRPNSLSFSRQIPPGICIPTIEGALRAGGGCPEPFVMPGHQ